MANLTNLNNKFLVTTGGDVGINTTSPGATLDISGTNAVVWVNPGAGSHAGINFRQGSVFKGWVGLNNTTGCINLSRDGSIAAGINVDSSNNVGIGLTSPTEKLDVEGNIQAINTAGSSVAYVDIVSGATWRLASNPTSGTNAYGLNIIKGSAGTDVKMAIDTNGNVGIGTTSPNTILEIASGNAGGDAALDAPVFRINNTTESADWDVGDVVGSIEYYTSDASGNAPYVASFIKSVNETGNGSLPDGALAFGTATYNASGGAVERVRITSTGNVGIGTTNPSNKLTVSEGTDQHGIELAPGTLSYIQAYDRATSDYGDLKIDAETIQFGTNNGTERMRIDSSGQVGIGTASPSYKLDVYHATTNVVSRFESGDNQVWIELHDDGSGSYGALLGHDSDAGHLFAVADANVTKQFVIEDSADVGIGTDSPNFRLDIVNAAASTATYMQFRNGTTGTGSGDGTVMGIDADGDFLINNQEAKEIKLYTSDSQRLTIQSGGNVGIGTSSPDYHLEIEDAASPAIALKDTTNNVITKMFSANSQGFVGTESNHDLRIRTNNTDKVSITSGGNVGIGTTSPSYRLEVHDDNEDILKLHNTTDGLDSLVTFTNPGGTLGRIQGLDNGGLQFDTGNNAGGLNTNVMYMSNTGNVGIGTTTPNEKLVVGTTGGTQNIEISNSYIQSFNRSGSPGYATLDFYSSTYTFNTGPAKFLSYGSFESTGNAYARFKHSTGGLNYVGSSESLASGFGDENDMLNYSVSGKWGVYTNSALALTLDESQNAIFTAKVGIGKTNPSTDLDVQGVITAGDSTTDGAIRRQHQTFATMKPGPSSGSGVDVMFVDHTHALDITVLAIIDVSNVATGRGYSLAAYGSATASLTQTQLLGNISALSISYVNTGGSENYVLRVTCTYSGGSAPEICVTATGQSASELRAAT